MPEADAGFGRGMAAGHTWSSLALEFDWTTGHLFDVPRDGSPGALVWFLVGETVCDTESGRNFLREDDFDAGLLQEEAIK
jgi:hypothetical protein